MLTVIFFVMVILGILINDSKVVRSLQYILIYIIFALNNWNQDERNYRKIYEGYYGNRYEPGFYLLCQKCYKSGISFESFRLVYVSVAILLLLMALHTLFKDSGNRAYSLVMLYPLLPMVELLRNFMAIAIVACGISWYLRHKGAGLNNKIIYTLIIVLATMFHYNALFFLVILLAGENESIKRAYYKVGVLAVASVLICNAPMFSDILNMLVSSEKVLNWFDQSGRIGFGIVLVVLFHFISYVIYDFIFKQYIYSGQCDRISGILYSLNVYSFVLMGLYTYNMEFFSRLYTLILILNCFHISWMLTRLKTENMLIGSLVNTIYHMIMFAFFCQPFNGDGIMNMVLQHNMLF